MWGGLPAMYGVGRYSRKSVGRDRDFPTRKKMKVTGDWLKSYLESHDWRLYATFSFYKIYHSYVQILSQKSN